MPHRFSVLYRISLKEKQMQTPSDLSSSSPLSSSLPRDGGSVAAKADTKIENITGSAHQAVDRVADAMSSVAHQLSEKSEELLAAQARVRNASRTTVCSHPFASVAIAIAAGVLISRLVEHREH
jgi:ElaB/YqjD/DUF883 family membrane-anchored ribosome-binding protein